MITMAQTHFFLFIAALLLLFWMLQTPPRQDRVQEDMSGSAIVAIAGAGLFAVVIAIVFIVIAVKSRKSRSLNSGAAVGNGK